HVLRGDAASCDCSLFSLHDGSSDLVPFAHRSKLLFDACSQQVFSVSPTQSGLKLLTEVGGLSRRRESAIQAEQMRSFGILGLARSEEHTSELQSRENLVCRLLLEKK